MKTSEHLDQLIPALAKARLDFGAIERTKENPHFKFKYAPLEKILAAVDKPLAQQQLVLLGEISNADNMVTVTTRLMHCSEQWMESAVVVHMPDQMKDLQELGKAITYIRRYSISTMLNVQADDDVDDHLGAEPLQERQTSRKTGQKRLAPAEAFPGTSVDHGEEGPKISHPTAEQVTNLGELIHACGLDVSAHMREILGLAGDAMITKKSVREAMSMAQYERSWRFYSDKLKENDVDDFSGPDATQEPPGDAQASGESPDNMSQVHDSPTNQAETMEPIDERETDYADVVNIIIGEECPTLELDEEGFVVQQGMTLLVQRADHFGTKSKLRALQRQSPKMTPGHYAYAWQEVLKK